MNVRQDLSETETVSAMKDSLANEKPPSNDHIEDGANTSLSGGEPFSESHADDGGSAFLDSEKVLSNDNIGASGRTSSDTQKPYKDHIDDGVFKGLLLTTL